MRRPVIFSACHCMSFSAEVRQGQRGARAFDEVGGNGVPALRLEEVEQKVVGVRLQRRR
jgi:hypothetical protein